MSDEYSYYRVSLDRTTYRTTSSGPWGAWEMPTEDGGWKVVPVPLSGQDYDHMHEITAEQAMRETDYWFERSRRHREGLAK